MKKTIKRFYVRLDYETSTRAGAGEMFQVVRIWDEDGKDYTSHIDQGIHYHSLDQVREDLAKSLGCSPSTISFTEE